MKIRSLLLLAIFSCAFPMFARADDWPQWRGPDRTDISRESGLLKSWGDDGPQLLWTYSDAGIGYSGPSIIGEKFFSMGDRGNSEYVFALDTHTGKQIWSTPIGQAFHNGYGDGPRATPTVNGDVLYALGAQGKLICAEIATGKERWQIDMYKDLQGQMMSGWGYSESPLVDGSKLICTPGGSQGTLAALDKKTGKVLWRSTELTDTASYSSCIVANVGGIRQYVVMTGEGVAGVAADDGRLLWHYVQPPGKYRVAVVATPIFHNNCVYVSADYNAGCDLVKLSANGQRIKAEKVYANKNMENHHGGVILVGEYLFGCSGNTNQKTRWVCQQFSTGRNVWEESRKLEAGSLTCADGLLYCYTQHEGIVALVEPSLEGWKEHGRFTIPRQTSQRSPRGGIWTHPVVSNGKLYLRDQELIFCYDVKDHQRSGR
jgi:outer membrane protein assembly factor BamB